jgi:hypothetical protein
VQGSAISRPTNQWTVFAFMHAGCNRSAFQCAGRYGSEQQQMRSQTITTTMRMKCSEQNVAEAEDTKRRPAASQDAAVTPIQSCRAAWT